MKNLLYQKFLVIKWNWHLYYQILDYENDQFLLIYHFLMRNILYYCKIYILKEIELILSGSTSPSVFIIMLVLIGDPMVFKPIIYRWYQVPLFHHKHIQSLNQSNFYLHRVNENVKLIIRIIIHFLMLLHPNMLIKVITIIAK